ncbi:hypothetical protein AVEN_56637-1 [Araneus ventricosus]|uniref:Uncharacterized protein n=1 Tax=Araneus ventricosus TaxID=182803 RepID=A0A4Y2N9I6_ARAVE|nr:hypothetical protein AVEN_56637-1 [Araneus ventricosus]
MVLEYQQHQCKLIPSHVNIQGNEIADALAKAGADDVSVPSAPLTYLELFSRAKSRNKTIWLIPPVHHWHQGSRPGDCLSIDCNRRDHTTLTRFLGGHIRSLSFSDNLLSVLKSAQNVLQNRPHLIIFFNAQGFLNRILYLILC